MPQLDLMSFFTQFFWFSLAFSLFYIIMLLYILPSIVLSLKFRKKVLEYLATNIDIKKRNVSDILITYDTVLQKAFRFSRLYINKVIVFCNVWILSISLRVNNSCFILVNSFFTRMIIEKTFCVTILNNKLNIILSNL